MSRRTARLFPCMIKLGRAAMPPSLFNQLILFRNNRCPDDKKNKPVVIVGGLVDLLNWALFS
jgi:hypothetical protein